MQKRNKNNNLTRREEIAAMILQSLIVKRPAQILSKDETLRLNKAAAIGAVQAADCLLAELYRK